MRRFHLLELEDQSWFPAVIRDLATDYLQFIQTSVRLDRAMAPLVRGVMEATGEHRIIDLCSGGSGPLLGLVNDLALAGLDDVKATMTDLFPNVPAFAEIAAASNGRIEFEREPVDARDVPSRLNGVRTIFHPADARAVLHAAAAARQPIAIFEVSERSLRTLPVLLTPLFVWLVTPFMRPFKWRRLFWTYLIPMVPFTCLWDGIVSQLRAYTVDELRAMTAGAAPMHWDIGQVPIAKGRGNLTYLIGAPRT